MKTLKLILLVLTMIYLCKSGHIIPDPNYPVLWKYASQEVGSGQLELRFKLPKRELVSNFSDEPNSLLISEGLLYNQYLGVRFQSGIFDFSSATSVSVKLSSSTINYKVSFTSSQAAKIVTTSAVAESNVCYILFDDIVNQRIPANELLTLTITFNTNPHPLQSNANPQTSTFIHNLGIFTSTSNNPDAIIIDNLPSFGNLGLYVDYKRTDNKFIKFIGSDGTGNSGGSIQIVSPSSSNTGSNSNSALYPGFTINIIVVIEFLSPWYLNPDDVIYFLRYDTKTFDYPTSITTENNSSDVNGLALTEALTLSEFPDGITINGILNKNTYPGRKIRLLLNGVKTKDNSTLGQSKNLELLVLYRSTYSVISYDLTNIGSVNVVSLDLVTYHPDRFEIYDGMAWPFVFEFKSPYEITGGGYVVIRQSSFSNTQSVAFVASSCDFSETNLEQNFGKRWNCYPLRNDFKYDSTGASDEGSGFYFKLASVGTDKYKIKIWAFAERCLGTVPSDYYRIKYSFIIRIFKNAVINDTVLNEKIFFDTSKNYIIAKSSAVSSLSNCYPLYGRSNAGDSSLYKIDLFKIKLGIATDKYPIGIEVNNLTIGSIPSDSSKLTNIDANDAIKRVSSTDKITTIGTDFTSVKYLFSSTDIASTNVLLYSVIPLSSSEGAATTYSLINYIPSECVATGTLFTWSSPTIQWVFSKEYLVSGTTFTPTSSANGCQLNWVYITNIDGSGGIANSGGTLKYPLTTSDTKFSYINRYMKGSLLSQSVAPSVSHGATTSITATRTDNIDSSKTFLDNSLTSTNRYQITSKVITDMHDHNHSLSMINGKCDKVTSALSEIDYDYKYINFGFYTDCLKWNSIPSTTKWLFSYFDMHQIMNDNNTAYNARVIRFVKLYPELDFSQSPTATEDTTASLTNEITEKWISVHYRLTTQTSTPYAVCLLEINSKIIATTKGPNSNTLIMFLFATSLLDVDITDSSSEYPVASVNVISYGLNAGQTISMRNRRIGDTSASVYPSVETDHAELERIFLKFVTYADYYTGVNPTTTAAETNTKKTEAGLPTGFFQQRTMYQFLLGSLVIIPTFTVADNTKNLYVPFLCPSATTKLPTQLPDNGIYFVNPIVSIAWLQMSSYANITGFDRYVVPNFPGQIFENFANVSLLPENETNGKIKAPIMTMALLTPIKSTLNLRDSNIRFADEIDTRTVVFEQLKVNFITYSNLSKSKTLELTKLDYNGKASAIYMFLNSDIATPDISVTLDPMVDTDKDLTFKRYNMTGKVYILGKPFNKFLAWGNEQKNGVMTTNYNSDGSITTTAANEISTFSLKVNEKIVVTGIPRLNITKYSTDNYGNINHLDYIAIFTSRNISDEFTSFKTNTQSSVDKMITNLRFNDSLTFFNFILWLPDVDSDTEWKTYLSMDDFDNFISSNEDSGNILISGSFPIALPKSADFIFTITSSNTSLNSSSKCGIEENGLKNIVSECKISSSTVTCTLTKPSQTYKICCYNLTYDNTQLTLSSGQIDLKKNVTTFPTTVASTFKETLYLRPNTAGSNFGNVKFSAPVVDLSNEPNFAARVTDLDYMISTTNSGFGVARFRVVLPRSPTRGMKLTISGSLSTSLKIPNLRTRVIASFGNSELLNHSPDAGDAFIDSTYTDFGDTTGIVVLLKNMVYKCGIKLSKHLNVYIYPVKTTNLNNFQVSVSMLAANGSSSMANIVPHKITSHPQFKINLVETVVDSTLCSLTKVEPTLPSMYAEYTFTFSFVSTSSKIEATEGLSINEVLIFFDHIHFGNMPNVICSNGSAYLQCNWIYNSILSVRYSSLPTSTDSAPIIKVIGIYNSHIPQSNTAVYYGCAVTQSDFISYRRIAVQGFTQHTKFLQPETESIYGNIIFKNELIETSVFIPNTTSTGAVQDGSAQGQNELNPREKPSNLNSTYTTKYSFGFTLDKANNSLGSTSLNYTFGPNIELYVTFPSDFAFHRYSLSSVTADLSSYVLSDTSKEIVEETQSSSLVSTNYQLNVSNVVIVGNQIRLSVTPATLILIEKFQYFILDIYNIPPPEDNTTDNQKGTYTTANFEFLMFSKNSSGDKFQVFRTWRNLNNWSKIDILTNSANTFLEQNKGLKFEFDQKKWIFDIYEKESNRINMINLQVGRYNTYYFRVRNISKLLNPISLNFQLTDEKITLLKNDYQISPFLFSDSAFDLGIPCNEIIGNRVIYPFLSYRSNDAINIYDYVMPLTFVNVKVVNFKDQMIYFQINNQVRIGGSTFVDFKLMNPAYSDINIVFTSGSESNIDACVINAKGNSCRTIFRLTNSSTILTQSFNLPAPPSCFAFQYDHIMFEISDIAAVIPNQGINKTHFEYENYTINPSDLLPNTINFKYNSVYSQIYVYAVLVCKNDNFPSDQDIISRNITETNNLKYYSEVLNVSGNAVISFKNVARGIIYKVRIIAQSTQGNYTLRTHSYVDFLNYTFKNGTVIDITAPLAVAPRCAQYRFNTIPGDQVTNPLLWYWQRQFTTTGFYEGGCILALDQYGTNIPGLPDLKTENFCNSGNCRFVKKENYTDSQVGLVLTRSYTICAYPYQLCESDPLNYDEIFNEILAKLPTNQTFNATLNTRVVPEFKLTEANDNVVPEKPLVSLVSLENKVTVTASSTKSQRCYLKLTTSSTPTVSDFDKCATDDCKVAQTSTTTTTYEFLNLSPGTYKLYGLCYNDMHCSVRNSGVIEFQSITISKPNTSTTNNNSSSTVSPNPNTNTGSSSSYLSLSIMMIISLLYVLLE